MRSTFSPGLIPASFLASRIGLKAALVPRFPGVTSAFGCVMADMRHDFVQTVNAMLDDFDVAALDARMVTRAREGTALLEAAGVAFEGIDFLFELDMSYLGQTHTVDVALPLTFADETTGVTAAIIRAAFEARYRHEYGRPLEGIAVRILNLRVAVIGRRPKFDLAILAPTGASTVQDARAGTRKVWIDGGWCEVAIYERLVLPVDATIAGPAILEQPDATIFIEPDLTGRVDRFGNLIITRLEDG